MTKQQTDELDENLKDILETCDDDSWPECVPEAIAQIRKAFAEAGWLPIEPAIRKYLEAGGDEKYYIISQAYVDKHCMTGQEWYERFQTQLRASDGRGPMVIVNPQVEDAILQAARRASGIREKP